MRWRLETAYYFNHIVRAAHKMGNRGKLSGVQSLKGPMEARTYDGYPKYKQ